MNRPSIYRWLRGRAGIRPAIAAGQSAYLRLRTATLIAGFRLFFLFTAGGARA